MLPGASGGFDRGQLVNNFLVVDRSEMSKGYHVSPDKEFSGDDPQHF